MTTEEKAKAYDEALERAKKYMNDGYTVLMPDLFPELAESEDEKIRKELIDFIKGINLRPAQNPRAKEEFIAYLEKQKECSFCNFPKSCDDCPEEIQAAIDKEFGIDGRDDNDNPLNGYGDWKKGMVLNGPAIWGLVKLGIELHKEHPKEELIYRLNGLMQDYIKEGKDDKEREHRFKCYQLFWDALEDTNFFEQKEQKPVNDKAFEEWIDDWWKHNKVNNPDSYDKGDEIQFDEQGFKNFCRGIRNMYQQKPAEWSEEDEKQYESVLNGLEYAHADLIRVGSKESAEIVSRTYTWFENHLKSLRPNPQWKPTDEQMDALNYVKQFVDYGGHKAMLESLYDDLKKLQPMSSEEINKKVTETIPVEIDREIQERAELVPGCDFCHAREVEDRVRWCADQFRYFYNLNPKHLKK